MAPRKPLTVEAIVKSPQLVSYRKLPAELIRAVLERLETVQSFESAFVREAMRHAPEGELEAHWQRTSQALSKAGRQYSLGDAAFRATLELMQTPWLLAACQAGAIAGPSPRVIAAALAKDGSEASHDALLAEFERARRDSHEWDLRHKLKKIARYARKNAAWASLEAAVHGELASRDEATAADEGIAARKLGLELPLLRWSLHLRSNGGQSVWVIIDDRRRSMSFQYLGRDGARSPRPDVLALPKVLAELAVRDQLTWAWSNARVTTNLRGRKRDAMFEWVQGKRASPRLER
jgi:hypothetical protein